MFSLLTHSECLGTGIYSISLGDAAVSQVGGTACAEWVWIARMLSYRVFTRQGHEAIAILYLPYKTLFQIICSLDSIPLLELWGWGVFEYESCYQGSEYGSLFCLIISLPTITAVTFAFHFWPGWLLQMCHFPYTGSLLCLTRGMAIQSQLLSLLRHSGTWKSVIFL